MTQYSSFVVYGAYGAKTVAKSGQTKPSKKSAKKSQKLKLMGSWATCS